MGARLGDERLEQLRVVPGLGMPEHAQRQAPRGILERLDRAVVRPRPLAQAGPDGPEALMVMRLDRHASAEQRAEPRAVLDAHRMLREDALHVPVSLVADDFG